MKPCPKFVRAVYVVRAANGLHQIGYAADVQNRVRQITRSSPVAVECVAWAPGGPRQLHAIWDMCDADVAHERWFKPTPRVLGIVKALRKIVEDLRDEHHEPLAMVQ